MDLRWQLHLLLLHYAHSRLALKIRTTLKCISILHYILLLFALLIIRLNRWWPISFTHFSVKNSFLTDLMIKCAHFTSFTFLSLAFVALLNTESYLIAYIGYKFNKITHITRLCLVRQWMIQLLKHRMWILTPDSITASSPSI